MVDHIVVGVAGAGKTWFGMEVVEKKLREGLRWDQVAFCSFSRAACQEAARRASVITGVDPERLQKDGWFRTIHSAAFRLLAVDSKSIVDHDTKAGKEFLTECCGSPRGGDTGTLGAKIDHALALWETHRAKLSRIVGPETKPAPPAPPNGCETQAAPLRPCAGGAPSKNIGGSLTQPCENTPIPYIGGKNIILSNSNENRCGTKSGGATDFFADLNAPYVGNIKGICGCPTKAIIGGAAHPFGGAPSESDTNEHIIRQYEDHKRYTGMMDFADLLFRYAGFEVNSDLMFRKCYPMGSVPAEVQVFLFDESQDMSPLLDSVADRLSNLASERLFLGDSYQNVYSFSGADSAVFASREREAKNTGKRTILNKSYRNPNCVIEWGEQVLREDSEYEERKPFSDINGGSVGMSEMSKFMDALPRMAKRDTMIVARTWFGLGRVKDRLDQLCIPWASVQEKKSSQWECPVKIAIVLTMRALRDGEKISEQDFRRLTENFPAKIERLELFKRGEKSRWKKLECSGELSKSLYEISEWGAGDGFTEFVIDEKWRKDMFLLLDTAIDKFGIDVVRSPKIKLGSCHSVKGLEATDVYCLATSSEKASQSSFIEDLCLRYVTITRAKKHYRCIVDLVEHGRGRKLFLAAPRGYWKFGEVFSDEEEGIDNPERDTQVVPFEGLDLDSEISRRDIRDDRMPGSDTMCEGILPRDGSQSGGRTVDGDAATSSEEDPYSEWDFSFGP